MPQHKVLVVDDFEPFRRFAESTLDEGGFQVVAEAADGLEAVEKAKGLRPDFILLDISMPKLNGIEAAELIRTVAPGSK